MHDSTDTRDGGTHWLLPNRRMLIAALYIQYSTNWPQPASTMDLFNPLFALPPLGRYFPFSSCLGFARLDKFDGTNSSNTIVSYVLTRFLDALCRKSARCFRILRCAFPTRCTTFFRRWEPRFLYLSDRCKRANFFSPLRKYRGVSIVSPVERVARCETPRSIPMASSL